MNELAIKKEYSNRVTREAGYEKVIEVDLHKAKYRGQHIDTASNFIRRKFENLIVLREQGRTKVIYS